VLAGVISIAIAGALWGLLDTAFVRDVTALDVWQAPTDSVMAQGRAYVIATWNWFLLLPVLRVGLGALVAARLRGASTNTPASTLVLLIAHLLLILWMLTFPEIGGALYEQADTTAAVADSGFQAGVDIAWEWGVGIIPAVLLLITDVWYLSEPIRNDLLRA
jgi:hypothetical protein